VGLQQRAELVAGRDLGLDVVLAQPHQGLELAGGVVQRLQSPQPVAVGAQVLGQLVAVTRIGLGTGGAPAGPGGVDRHDRVAGSQQPIHDQPAGLLDRHWQLLGPAPASQPDHRFAEACLGVWRCPVVGHGAGVVDHGDVMGGTGPVPADNIDGAPVRSGRIARWWDRALSPVPY
jgi:hypothetical protein